MTNQPWMIFKVESENVFYFWNGTWPILVQNCTSESWYWDGPEPLQLSDKDQQFFNEIASSKKRVFKAPEPRPCRMQVIERGVFETE